LNSSSHQNDATEKNRLVQHVEGLREKKFCLFKTYKGHKQVLKLGVQRVGK
jgi:hypothetical protein